MPHVPQSYAVMLYIKTFRFRGLTAVICDNAWEAAFLRNSALKLLPPPYE